MKHILFLFIFSLFDLFSLYAQPNCSTGSNFPNLLSIYRANECPPSNENIFVVKVYVHVVNNSVGEGGRSEVDINEMLMTVIQDFAPLGIYFSFYDTEPINDDDFYDFRACGTDFFEDCPSNDPDDSVPILNQHGFSDGLNIFFLGDIFQTGQGNPLESQGFAYSIPGTAIAIGGFNSESVKSNHGLSHEIGHCLGLFHTFHSENQLGNDSPCEEGGCMFPVTCCTEVNNLEPCKCGDFVEDTTPDPCVSPNQNCRSTCTNYTPGGLNSDCPGPSLEETPPFENIMSYAYECRNHFTPGQKDRMKDHFLFEPLNGILDSDIHISIDLNWDINIENEDETPICFPKIVVWEGGHLNVTAQINFETDNGITVEKGGKLTLDGGILTG